MQGKKRGQKLVLRNKKSYFSSAVTFSRNFTDNAGCTHAPPTPACPQTGASSGLQLQDPWGLCPRPVSLTPCFPSARALGSPTNSPFLRKPTAGAPVFRLSSAPYSEQGHNLCATFKHSLSSRFPRNVTVSIALAS